jgi:hypothetical protein
MTAPDAPGAPDAPTTLPEALARIARAEAAFVAAVEAQLAAQRTAPAQGAVAARALEAGIEAIVRHRCGPGVWVRRTVRGRVLSVDAGRRFAQVRVPPAGAGPSTTETVQYGAGTPVVGQWYPVYFPVRLPDAPTPLLTGPTPADLPWLKAPAGARWLYWKEPAGTRLWRYAWPPPPAGPDAAWTSELVRDDIPRAWELFGSSTPPATADAAGGTEVVFREQTPTRVFQEPDFDGYAQFVALFHHYGALGFGAIVRTWRPAPGYVLPQAIANEGQTVGGGNPVGAELRYPGGGGPGWHEEVRDVQT